MDIKEILQMADSEAISALKTKSFNPPSWSQLSKEYDPKQHPIMSQTENPDVINSKGHIEKVVRVAYDLQRLAVKRMTELCFGIPTKRIYHAENERQLEVQNWLENIFTRNRIDSINIERGNMYFASCEVITLWYGVEDQNNYYGFNSNTKIRCRNFCPMNGDQLYPLFDELGDMIALSVQYTRSNADKQVTYFDTYTKDLHIRWSNETGEMIKVLEEKITIGKIPGVYFLRKTPIWEDTSNLVNELEYTVSRNGDYLKKNSKPLLIVSCPESMKFGNEKERENRSVVMLPSGGSAQYVTWQQAVDSLKFYTSELRQMFFTQLQLPDWSYESMKSVAMSGESRKQLFIDAMLKVKDESGRLQEVLDREISVVKSFLKTMQPGYAADIDALQVETEIVPFSIGDDADTINNLMSATGGKAIMSQKTAIANLGWVADIDSEMEQIANEGKADAFGLAD